MAPTPIRVDDRIDLGGDRGTVRFVGSLQGRGETVWAGVEWDDAGRGRHDGSVDGHEYFSCTRPGAGSFVKLVKLGSGGRRTLMQAVTQRYCIDAADDGTGRDAVNWVGGARVELVLPSDSSTVGQVDFASLKIVDVSGMGVCEIENGDTADAHVKHERLGDLFTQLRELRVADNLLNDVRVVPKLVKELPELHTLDASRNLFLPVAGSGGSFRGPAVSKLRALVLNQCNLEWETVLGICAMAPHLCELRLHRAGLGAIRSGGERWVTDILAKVEVLDLDSNSVPWQDVQSVYSRLPSLRELFISNNGIDGEVALQPGVGGEMPFPSLHKLGVSENPICNWDFVTGLMHIPRLCALLISCTPLSADEKCPIPHRLRVIARLPTITTLDGSIISSDERLHAERRYLADEALPARAAGHGVKHPRLEKLLSEHSTISAPTGTNSGALRSELVRVTFRSHANGKERVRAVPRTTRVEKLRAIARSGLRLSRSTEVRLELENETVLDGDWRNLSYWGLSGGDEVVICVFYKV